MPRFPAQPVLSLAAGAAAIWLLSLPAAAQAAGYHLGMLTEDQRAEVMRRLDGFARIETFLKACGRPPGLELRFRRAAAGCVTPQTMDTLAVEYRRSLASRAGYRWDCNSPDGRRMIARSEEAIAKSFADLAEACRRE